MEESILLSVKKLLGLDADYIAFDEDIKIHINSVFSLLGQLGVGPGNDFFIVDETAEWADFFAEEDLNLIRTYTFLRVRMMFDPPQTSFLLESMNSQIKEFEWRISTQREWNLDPNDPMEGAA